MDTQGSAQQDNKPARHRRWLPLLAAFVLILGGLAWYAYQQRSALLINAANSVLQPYGFYVNSLSNLRFRATSLHIGQLSLLHIDSNLSQTLSDIRIHYTVTGLINGHLDTVSIATADIVIPDISPRSPAASDPQRASLSVNDILTAIPFSQLNIDHLRLSISDMTVDSTQVLGLSADLSALQIDCRPSGCRVISKLSLAASKLIYRTDTGATELDHIAFDSVESINITAQANTNNVAFDARSSTLTLPAIRFNDSLTGMIINIRYLNASHTLAPGSFDPTALDVDAEISVSDVFTNLTDLNLRSMRLDQHLNWQQEALVVTGALVQNNQHLLINELRHDTALRTGQGILQIPRINFDNNSNKLSDLLSPLPWQADVVSGSASANARLNWFFNDSNRAVATGTVQVTLDDISGNVNEIAFVRLNTDIAADLLPDWELRSTRNATLNLASLNAGIELNNLRSDEQAESVTGHELSIGATRVQDLSAELRSVQMSCQSSRCRITSELGLSVSRLWHRTDDGVVELDLIAFNSDESINISAEANTNTVSIDARSFTLTLPAIRVDDTLTGLVLSIGHINATQTLSPEGFDPAGLNVYAEMSVSEVYTNLVDFNLWSMRLDQHLSWQQGTLVVTGALVQNNQRLLINELRHDTALRTGQGILQIPPIDFDDNNKLSDLLSPLPWQADVVSGSASASARLNWFFNDSNRAVATGTVQVTLDDISGYVNEIVFLHLGTDFAADLLPDWGLRSSRAAAINVASLDAGIELSNLRSDYRIDSVTGSVALANASFDVLGGTVSSEQLEYRLQDNDSRFTIVIDSIDLNQVLGMNAYRGVSATGLVSGQLPVRLQGLKPSIRGGTLSALQPGGTIRYGTGASGAANLSVRDQSLDLVYQALEHYRFTLMETTVDYQESGELDLTIRMEGVSPELNDGQRINLNLTINDDIPALLQSLQAARTVTDTIQARLDARQE